ncbi:hypothetical protein PV08_07958 [Exophiala spinifera]|uniref:FAD-binding domain-containing protein n=1 Tax=Exophiala spinifera TaxID=91928 RepID=A0A0D1YCU1_9EURO|nr:uncharacterized protein PV08_07958 [Exophiala spinifera]KIW12771.1 hypothetical protein PV08_07958 [Exophiala spinifera]
MKIIIVGCGLGGLACAIACHREGLQVLLLERAPSILPVGAGIQIPPNATRIMQHFGLEDRLRQRGAVRIHSRNLLRYSDGHTLCNRPGLDDMVNDFGASYYVIHRADYQELLLEEAVRIGVDFRPNSEVSQIIFDESPKVVLRTGDEITADVIVGADVKLPSLWSTTRDQILGRSSPPQETGDLAFRGTFPLARLEKIEDDGIRDLITSQKACLWMGPDKHCSFYPVRNGQEFNLVLLTPDDLSEGIRTSQGSINELRYMFEGWDPTLLQLISCMNDSLLKWKLCHHTELESWVKGSVVLLGDACHPSLPYQAQGAAMAVEDGAVLGLLLGKFSRLNKQSANSTANVHSLLKLYESIRKSRTTTNVLGSIRNREMFHMHDGIDQRKRDEELSRVDWKTPCPWQWGDIGYQNELMGFDAVKHANVAFEKWTEKLSGDMM